MHAMKQSERGKNALRALTPFAIIAGVELVLFWPLIQRLSTALHDRFDTMLNTWILTWQARELIRAPLSVFNAPIFHPLPNMLALSEIIWPAAPMTVPILAASGNPLLVYNLTFLGTVFLAAVGMYLLALYVTHNRGAALLAGIFYAFSPYQFGHIPQVQLLSIGWLPLTLLYLDRFWTKGRRHDGLMLALFMAAQTLSTFYYGFQVVLVVGIYVLVRLLLQPRKPTLRRLGQLLPWLVLSGLLILPLALPYLRVRSGLGLERSLTEAAEAGANLAEFFLPRNDNPIYPAGLRSLVPHTGDLFPGIIGGPAGRTGLCHLAEGASRSFQPGLPDRVGVDRLDPGTGAAAETEPRPSDRHQPAVRLAVRTRPRHDSDPRAGAFQRDALPGPRPRPRRRRRPGCSAE